MIRRVSSTSFEMAERICAKQLIKLWGFPPSQFETVEMAGCSPLFVASANARLEKGERKKKMSTGDTEAIPVYSLFIHSLFTHVSKNTAHCLP
jgi:hypothetical protein